MSRHPAMRGATVMDCAHAAAIASGVPVAALLGRTRVPDVTRARHLTAWLARRATVASLPAIGRVLGRDHSTVWQAERVATDLIRHDAAFARRAEAALAALLKLHNGERAS